MAVGNASGHTAAERRRGVTDKIVATFEVIEAIGIADTDSIATITSRRGDCVIETVGIVITIGIEDEITTIILEQDTAANISRRETCGQAGAGEVMLGSAVGCAVGFADGDGAEITAEEHVGVAQVDFVGAGVAVRQGDAARAVQRGDTEFNDAASFQAAADVAGAFNAHTGLRSAVVDDKVLGGVAVVRIHVGDVDVTGQVKLNRRRGGVSGGVSGACCGHRHGAGKQSNASCVHC